MGQEGKVRANDDLQYLLDCYKEGRDDPDPKDLRAAIISARDAGIHDAVLSQGAFLLATLERKTDARQKLKDALHPSGDNVKRGAIFTNSDVQMKLIGAFNEANLAGLDDEELAAAKAVFGERRKAMAADMIEEAIRSKELAQLEKAIGEGLEVGVADYLLKRANTLFQEQIGKLGKGKEFKAKWTYKDEEQLMAWKTSSERFDRDKH